ncbi:MAG: hypothetical protein GYB64_06145 [Chloroflexi bacterium]|nr:hypothetical protein [Chloroflexota bacterium]
MGIVYRAHDRLTGDLQAARDRGKEHALEAVVQQLLDTLGPSSDKGKTRRRRPGPINPS